MNQKKESAPRTVLSDAYEVLDEQPLLRSRALAADAGKRR